MRHRLARHTTVGLVALGLVMVAAHVGLGGGLLASGAWAGWTAAVVVLLVVVKVAIVVVFARRRTTRPAAERVLRSSARVPTPKAERYAKQLCGHASWKARHVSPDGVIEFPDGMGTCRVTAEPAHLVLAVEATSQASLDRIQDIVAANIERFARRDGLTVAWAQE